MTEAMRIAPGDLVRARGREWVALPSSGDGLLRLRPLSGGEADVQELDPSLELEPVEPARFAPPDPGSTGTQDAARLLRDALRLSLRRGAGPFRSAARLGFEPRAYQLVPLMMALKLDPIRLLIADDVGVGKTIEAGLILRELADRGEAERLTVLCPPHLVEQWTDELSGKFDFDPVAVTASSARRLERDLPTSESLFEAHPVTVVSLDYIKADRRRAEFQRACPKLVVVDEAHASVGVGRGRHQRESLLTELASDPDRHLILLTATPHSGNEAAFDRLIGLLDPAFGQGDALVRESLRERLARHFVQRRRIDIVEGGWGEERAFPRHETTELPFRLDGDHLGLQEAVLDYCLSVTDRAGDDQRRRRLAFWGTLALMRCVGSSPAAAASALRNRLGLNDGDTDEAGDDMEAAVFDEEAGALSDDDVEPSARMDRAPAGDEAERRLLRDLVARAEALEAEPAKDPKLRQLAVMVKRLLGDGHAPVVFCRYIATAEWIGAYLRRTFPKIRLEVVTGTLTAEERRARVDDMGEAGQRILVATDCLSEGINLQRLFDAVVHYDLSWNPTRHQQREGRVDRFGQPSPLVRTILMFGENSAIDGAVLQVILRKADAIRRATGVTVPLPDDRAEVTGALMHALLLRREGKGQLSFDFAAGLDAETRAVEAMWRDAEEGEKRSRTRFAQRPMRPDEVLAEWNRARTLLGDTSAVERFVDRALKRLDAAMQSAGAGWRVPLDALPAALRERLAARGLAGTLRVAFADPPHGHVAVHRGHPLCATLAEALLEGALDPDSADGVPLARAGVWRTAAVDAMTTVALLRLRHTIRSAGRERAAPLLAEEVGALAWRGTAAAPVAAGDAALGLLDAVASGDLPLPVRERQVAAALARIGDAADAIADYARGRAAELAADHARVREAARAAGRIAVEPVLPADVIGLYVLLPAEG